MVSFDGGVLDRAVHALDLAVCPGVLNLGQPVFDVIFHANPIEDMRPRPLIGFAVGELDPVIGQDMGELG